MGLRYAYTLTEARENLELWKECERALAEGQAKEYVIGTRRFTAIDLDNIREQIRYYADVVEALTTSNRTARGVRVVPRDL